MSAAFLLLILLLRPVSNRQFQIAVPPGGPQPPAPDGSVPSPPQPRASAGDLNREFRMAVFPAGP